jgi:hypothetical protein
MTAIRIKQATNATPPTTPPAMAPGLTWAEADAAVVSGCATAVDDVDADDGDDVDADDWDGRVAEVVDFALVVDAVLVGDAEDDRNAAAMAGFESRKPAVKSPVGQPVVHGLDLQQPMKGGSVLLQVYQLLPWGHCWSGKLP